MNNLSTINKGDGVVAMFFIYKELFFQGHQGLHLKKKQMPGNMKSSIFVIRHDQKG